jgi:hypothetical protein
MCSTLIKHTGVPIAPIPHHFRSRFMCTLSKDALTKHDECSSMPEYRGLDKFMRNGYGKRHIKLGINRCALSYSLNVPTCNLLLNSNNFFFENSLEVRITAASILLLSLLIVAYIST